MDVYILTTYKNTENFFGSSCVFNTIRKGFPNSNVFVFDNDSDHSGGMKAKLQRIVLDAGCEFHMLNKRIQHHEFITKVLKTTQSEEIVFLDTDVVFFDEVESKIASIEALIAGQYAPEYYNPLVRAIEYDRIHTALLYIKDVKRLNAKIAEVVSNKKYPFDAISPTKLYWKNQAIFFDTCAQLYHMLSVNDIAHFDESILSCYGHLNCGTMVREIIEKWPDFGVRLKEFHTLVEHNPEYARNHYKNQIKFYQNHAAFK